MTPAGLLGAALLAAASAAVAQGALGPATQPLTVELKIQGASGKTLPAANVTVHFTVVMLDRTTSDDGRLTIALKPGAYRLGALSQPGCSYAFAMPADKPLELRLVAVAGQPMCRRQSGGPPAPGAVAADSS